MSQSGDIAIPAGFKEMPHWADHHFRTVWISDRDLSTITYCEGDVTVTQHSNRESYDLEMLAAEVFYKTH